MLETPKSLTAVVHVRFNYNEKDAKKIKDKPPGQGDLEMLNNLMDQAYDLPVDLQEMLIKFGNYLKLVSSRDGGAEPPGK